MLSPEELSSLHETSVSLRKDIVRMIYMAGSGHPGGSLSAIDILNVLYHKIMRHTPQDPQWPGRDRFVLSKGHACPALYAVLADCGYFDRADLDTLRKFGSNLQGHPYMHKTKGIEVSGGSLGQGLSVAAGMALAAKAEQSDCRVYCMMGDGENEEGQIWEAAMAAAHYKLDNLCAIVDHNHLQIDGNIADVLSPENLSAKWRAFNWNVIEIDGHDFSAIYGAFIAAKKVESRPTVIIAETVKGKGVSFMENNAGWHGVAPNEQQFNVAMAELGQ